jgi:hypothetical protein
VAQLERSVGKAERRTVDRASLEASLERSLRAMERRLDDLCDALGQSLESLVDLDTQGTDSPMEEVCTAYGQVDLKPLEDKNHSVTRLGVVGVPSRVIVLAERVNEAKLAMKQVWADAQTVKYPAVSVVDDASAVRVPLPRLVLRRIGRAQLNLMAAYRKVPILPMRPVRVVFACVLTRSVYRRTRRQLETMLQRFDPTIAEKDLKTLAASDVKDAALVGKRYPNFRANVWYDGLDANGRGRVQIRAELPMLYPLGRSRRRPEVIYPPPDAAQRSEEDLRLRKAGVESEPFLPLIGAHRYAAD